MNGPSNFKVKLYRRDMAEIADAAENPQVIKDIADFIISGAPVSDVTVARILLALKDYMKLRHVEVDYEVVLSE